MASKREKDAAMQEVHDALKRKASGTKTEPEWIRNYMKSELSFFGLTVPVQRDVMRAGYSFLEKEDEEVLEIWDHVWSSSDNFEVMAQPLLYYGHKARAEFLIHAWPVISGWSSRLENWAHSDGLSSLYVKILEQERGKVFPTLLRWNKSTHPWQRRQSVVSILYYSSARTAVLPYEKIIPLVRNLLLDEEYYVQKGVGWTLRELTNVHPVKTREFLLEHATRIHPAAFGAAVEKLSARERDKLKALRASYRKNRRS